MAARWVHTPEVPGSIPGIATEFRAVSSCPSRTFTPLPGLTWPGRFFFGFVMTNEQRKLHARLDAIDAKLQALLDALTADEQDDEGEEDTPDYRGLDAR